MGRRDGRLMPGSVTTRNDGPLWAEPTSARQQRTVPLPASGSASTAGRATSLFSPTKATSAGLSHRLGPWARCRWSFRKRQSLDRSPAPSSRQAPQLCAPRSCGAARAGRLSLGGTADDSLAGPLKTGCQLFWLGPSKAAGDKRALGLRRGTLLRGPGSAGSPFPDPAGDRPLS